MLTPVATNRYVTIPLASTVIGYTVEAIETKIRRGVWVEGRQWKRAPDKRVLIDLKGYEEWVENQSPAVYAKSGARSASTSGSAVNA